MNALITEEVKRLEFEILHPGDKIEITTGADSEAWHYDFEVDMVRHWPSGQITATTPTGEQVTPVDFTLHGCGRWTTPRENPVQKQMEKAFTPYYDGLIVGSFMWGKFPGEQDRAVFDKPGQEISNLVHTPYRENLVARALGTSTGPLSVSQIVEVVHEETGEFQLENARFFLERKDIRKTLQKLMDSKRVSLLRGKVQKFTLNQS